MRYQSRPHRVDPRSDPAVSLPAGGGLDPYLDPYRARVRWPTPHPDRRRAGSRTSAAAWHRGGGSYPRRELLVEIKRRYDSSNLFRMNQISSPQPCEPLWS
ncbi:MAG: BBE domain-containing protein, partial [Candidatus Limnocylindrales bacterium]